MTGGGVSRGPSVVAAMLLFGSLTARPAGELPRARVTFDSLRQRLVIESPAADLPAGTAGMPAMVDVSPSVAVIPAALSLYSVRVDVLDSAGRALPKAFLHHFNL